MDNAALLGAIRESLTELASTQAAVLTKEEALRLVSPPVSQTGFAGAWTATSRLALTRFPEKAVRPAQIWLCFAFGLVVRVLSRDHHAR
jgi:hypothetical protein